MIARAMGFVGFHNSGKTTLLVRLAEHLRKLGRRVGVVKSSRHGFDLGDTDTGKLAATGSPVAGMSPDQTMVLLPWAVRLESLPPLLDVDVLLVEGGKNLGSLPRIVIPRTPEDIEALDAGLAYGYWGEFQGAALPRLSRLEDVAGLVLEKGFLLPALDCGACDRESCAEMARDIVAGRAAPEDCRAMASQMEVRVNGVPLGMNPFVATVLTSTLKGMLSPLKGYVPGRIDIHVEEA